MSSDGDVFLHDAEVIEPTEQKTTAVCPQVEVHLFTCEPTYTNTHVLVVIIHNKKHAKILLSQSNKKNYMNVSVLKNYMLFPLRMQTLTG